MEAYWAIRADFYKLLYILNKKFYYDREQVKKKVLSADFFLHHHYNIWHWLSVYGESTFLNLK